MATLVASSRLALNSKTEERMTVVVPTKATPRVTFQSVPPNTTVRRGETINVRLVSSSDVLLKNVTDKEFVPKVANLTLEEVEKGVPTDTLELVLDPVKMQDPGTAAQVRQTMQANFGFSDLEANEFIGALQQIF